MENTKLQLSKFQYSVWKGQKIHPKAPLYNMCFTFDIYGKIDPEIFRDAFTSLVSKTTILKLVLTNSNENVPKQIIGDLNPDIEYLDASSDDQFDLESWIKEKNAINFNLEKRSYYTALIKQADQHYVWYINQHHIFTDAYSFQVIYTNLSKIYQSKVNDQSENLNVIDDFESYAALIEKDKQEKSKEHLALKTSANNNFTLYGQAFSTQKQTKSDRTSTVISKELTEKVLEKISEMKLRTFSANLDFITYLITSLLVLLSQISNRQTGLSISNIFSKRLTRLSKEIAQPLLEVLSHYIAIDKQETFISLYKKVYSFLILRETEKTTLAPSLSPIIINFFNLDFGNFGNFDTDCKWHHCDHMDDHHNIRLHVLKYKSSENYTIAFDIKTLEAGKNLGLRLTNDFVRIITKISEFDSSKPINELCIVSDQELNTLQTQIRNIGQYTQDKQDYVQHVINEQIKTNTDKIAIQFNDLSITYGQLDHKITLIRHHLEARGITENSKVVVYLPRSENYVYTILAILFSKACFVPVPTIYPVERLKYIVSDVGADLLISSQTIDDISVSTLQIKDCLKDTFSTNTTLSHDLGEMCYVLYTSGSSGPPKGVSISHSSFSNYINSISKTYCEHGKYNMPFFTSVGFDLTMTSIFLPLYTGGTIHIYEEQAGLNIQIRDVVKNPLLNCLKCTPSHLKLLEEQEMSQSIQSIIVGGEKFESHLAKSVYEKNTRQISIYNEYGPTEATVGCIVHKYINDPSVNRIDEPIGLPLKNVFAFIANDAGIPIPQGVIGELCVGGSGLANGYINNPEITALNFIDQNSVIKSRFYKTGDQAAINENGVFEFYGRKDEQLKIGGIRIETGEISHYLNTNPNIRSSLVTSHPDGQATKSEYTYCKKCGLPSNYPTADFDSDQVCTYCRSFENYKTKVEKYFQSEDQFAKLFDSSKDENATHDCIMLYSGGKDSTYALGKLAKMGLNVLAFTLDNGYISEKAKENINRIVSTLGVDHVYGSSPAMNEIFVDSLKTHCNVCNGCFKTIYNLSLKIAFEKQIPYIVTGLSRGQFFETKLSEEIFWKPMNDVSDIEDTLFRARKAYHTVQDVAYQKAGGQFIEDNKVLDHVKILDFYRYHDVSLEDLLKFISTELPWVRPDDTGRSTNCLINKVGIHTHKNKKGYSNYAFPYSWDVRTGHKTKEETIDEIEEYIDEIEVNQIIQEIGYTEDRSNTQLVSYYTGQEIDSIEIKEYLMQYLPHYMIPSKYIYVDEFPLTINGKVDLLALQRIEKRDKKKITEPATEIEEVVHSIWKEVLEENVLSTSDDFFDLGGTSLDALRIVARIEKVINYKLEVKYIFELPNIIDLSKHIMQDMLSIIENNES